MSSGGPGYEVVSFVGSGVCIRVLAVAGEVVDLGKLPGGAVCY